MHAFLAVIALTALVCLAFEMPTAKASPAGTATPHERSNKSASAIPAPVASKSPALSPSSSPTQSWLPANSLGPSVQSALIDMTIETSRPQPTVGVLGISAVIKNISNSTIYLRAEDMDLVLPPELEVPGTSVNATYPFFPTEIGPDRDPYDVSIILSPGDSYPAFWRTNPNVQSMPEEPDARRRNPTLRRRDPALRRMSSSLLRRMV